MAVVKIKNKDFDFTRNLEIPQAKSFTTSYATIDSSDGRMYILMKLECVMKDSWKIDKFPFDYQNLRLSFENSQFDSSTLVFALDTAGANHGRFTISGWTINEDSFKIAVRNQPYLTAFGDESISEPYMAYSAFKMKIGIKREGEWTLFWKLFIGMYVSFLISYVCFYIHPDKIDARFGLCVGSLFAVVGNKYIVEASLPDSSSVTLVDSLHSLTLVFIFAVITSTIISMNLIKENNKGKAIRFDKIVAQSLLTVYTLLNLFFIGRAYWS